MATKKNTAVKEFKIGCLYSNKNGKEYLCIPDFDYLWIEYFCMENVRKVCDGIEKVVTETYINYINNKLKTVFQD